jgi:hypothetical protein
MLTFNEPAFDFTRAGICGADVHKDHGPMEMSRGVQLFKQGDLTKAIKVAVKSGVRGWRVEIVEGKIIILAADGIIPFVGWLRLHDQGPT